MAQIELKNASKTYKGGEHPALHSLDLTVDSEEVLVILGPSGCGKTTTLRLIAGFEQPDAGTVSIGGNIVAGKGKFVPPEKRGVGTVFQDYALFPHLTIEQNIRFGLQGLNEAVQRERIAYVMNLVGMSGREKRYPHEISGGQQQRVAVARSLAPKPDILLLDEPLSNLDADLRIHMRGELSSILREAGTTSVMVTHDQEDAFSIADRIAVFDHGVLEQIGTAEDIYHSPQSRFVADFVGDADFVSGVVAPDGVQTSLGFVKVETKFAQGSQVEILIRPDDAMLYEDGSGNAVILERHFRGTENTFKVRLDSGELIHSTHPSHEDFKVDSRVRVETDMPHVVVISKDSGEVDCCEQ